MKFASLGIIQHLYGMEFCDFRLHKNCIWYKRLKLWGVRSIAFASRCLSKILAPLVFIKCTENSNDSMTNVDLREFWTLDTKTIFPSLKIYHDLSICQVLPFLYKVNFISGLEGWGLDSGAKSVKWVRLKFTAQILSRVSTTRDISFGVRWNDAKSLGVGTAGDWGVKENKENLMYISLDAQDVSLWISIDPFWCLEYLSLKKFT